MSGCRYCNWTAGESCPGDVFDPNNAHGTFNGKHFVCARCGQKWESADGTYWRKVVDVNVASGRYVESSI